MYTGFIILTPVASYMIKSLLYNSPYVKWAF